MNDQIWQQLEETELWEVPEIGWIKIRNAVLPMRTEVHSGHMEFLFLYSGRKLMWVENKRYDMQGGDLLLIFPGERHGAEDIMQDRSSLAYFLMTVPANGSRFCMLEEPEQQELWARLREIPTRKFGVSGLIRREIDQLLNGLLHLKKGSGLEASRVRARLLELLFQILETKSGENDHISPDISAVIQYIGRERGEMPSISQMAALINLSESRFKQKFKQETGVPPAEFVVRQKIGQARELLTETRRSVTSIAMELGFTSSQHFSVLFKKYAGESPVQYRKKHEFVP